MWFLKILRMMFVTLDNAVYQCVDWLYQLFMMLAETGIFSSTDIRNFADRMYFFLGLIMIFKVSISIIQYIMNPDSVKDNKIGAPALLKNIVIILVGIVMIPYVFEAAYSLQRIVLKDNVIGSLILGMNYSSDDESKDMVQNAGNRMAFSTYTAFFHFDTAYISDECSNNPIKQDEKGNYLGEMSDACANDANRQGIDEFFNSKGADSFKKAYETLNMHKLYNDSIYNYTIKDENGEEQFLFSYLIVITTLAGGFLAYILLLFCFDIAVRSVKLGFLQLIAPIPLIAKIDPKKGQETFNKWVKECISTYLQLFLRLASIYFAIFIISIIGKGMFNVVEPDKDWNNPFVFVFIIFGTLLFVKDLPKLIESITGVKMGTDGLSLKKKLGSVPLVGGAANKAVGLAGRTALGLGRGAVGAGRGIGRYLMNDKFANSKLGQNLAAKKASAQTKWNNYKDGLSQNIANSQFAQGARNLRYSKLGQEMANVGKSAFAGAKDSLTDIGNDAKNTFNGMGATIADSLGMLESKKNQILNRQSAGKIEMERNKKLADAISAMENRAVERIKTGAGGELSERYNRESKTIEVLTNEGKVQEAAAAQYKLDQWMNSNDADGAASQYIDRVVNGTKVTTTDVNGNEVDVKDNNGNQIYSYTSGDGSKHYTTVSDGTLQNGLYQNYQAQASANGIQKPPTDGATIHKELSKLKTKNNEIQRDQMEGNNEISKIDEQIRASKEFKSGK